MANTIHDSAVIGEGVRLGTGNVIGPFAVIGGGARLGDGNWVGAHAVIGAPPEVRGFEHRADWLDIADVGLRIGDGNVIREAAQIHAGWRGETVVGSRCFLMNQSYLAHDVQLADAVTLASGVALAGHVRVAFGANLGLGTNVHQGRAVGAYAMIGMGSVVTRDMPPFVIAHGSPARPRRVNRVGLERSGFSEAEIRWVEQWCARGCPTIVEHERATAPERILLAIDDLGL
ncbi:LbetaH domain-containing protein [Protaetiibacter intestinalis]|uniref:UDP-N-acetylglucosamine acyltransferase n=1 Tax=Protaetiibacter intestinalis TaxID=2419774 RepID=A0A387B9C3_9MICO|nr:UDP-N-acetylglucosamine acyltransferase [Protaetiibacter intestinalis]AYF98358.1 UDP-N-acetylglucosamine acyltransferase [Protaetiibacter intestinalis]